MICLFHFSGAENIYYISETGNILNVANFDFTVKFILHHPKKDLLVVILSNGSINQFSVHANGQLQNITGSEVIFTYFDRKCSVSIIISIFVI